MERVYNFSAGPSMLPLEVLEQAQKEFVNYKNTGMSVMEMSHRSKDFEDIIFKAEDDLRDLMAIPDNYSVLFLQGGGSTQFAMIPLNLMNKNHKADYVKTGQWSKKAIAEAKRYGNVNVVASSEDKTFTYIPKLDPAKFDKDADYFYMTLNNTIYGTHIPDNMIPDTGNVPRVGDMSSNILAERYDVSKFGLIFAGAQKNLGPAGVTIAIVRKDLMGNAMDFTPTMLRYDTHAEKRSLYNTPPTYSIYFAGLVFQWVKKMGGIDAMQKINEEKAAIVYKFLDESDFFKGTVVPENRSLMNAPFVLPTEELNAKFIAEAKAKGFVNLKGHRTVGGMRASMYNAMPIEGVKKLVEFMKKFETENK
ncbi:MAG: 3-phosphoserine/phosphohydroxythreonine transaminase [Clostridia bacterium]|jgi:phosphoserine aminotransferase|nr:3-phosphoserine/phosphohydroxythreonine transaminase [Clostridia bacterium]MCI1999647.1 3-phosphoserine/phosphohydroxythreonine transaminase [Clostridia bacterium]MCI2013974.1 3-phosphoserine/phosphohydroxythreonine transaminase [Clostridia bacterium]